MLEYTIFVTPPSWLMNTLGAFIIVKLDTVMAEPPFTTRTVGRTSDEFTAKASYASWPFPSMRPVPVRDWNLALLMLLRVIIAVWVDQ